MLTFYFFTWNIRILPCRVVLEKFMFHCVFCCFLAQIAKCASDKKKLSLSSKFVEE